MWVKSKHASPKNMLLHNSLQPTSKWCSVSIQVCVRTIFCGIFEDFDIIYSDDGIDDGFNLISVTASLNSLFPCHIR